MAILLNPNKEAFKIIIKLLEEYSFKIFHVSARKSNTGDSKLYKLAYKIYQNSLSATDAFTQINDIINEYYDFILFKNQVNELFKTGTKFGFYKWTGIKYFLFEYDLFLRFQNKITERSSEINWDDFVSKNSIEHIYPQSAAMSFEDYCIRYEKTNSSLAKVEYDEIQTKWDSFSSILYEERWAYCNSIGNLLALTTSLNSSISNDKFEYKKDQGLKSPNHHNKGFKYDSLSARIVANKNVWDSDSIIERGEKMLDFLWLKLHPEKPNTLTQNDKYELLGLYFLIN